jgi:hypothetical protein
MNAPIRPPAVVHQSAILSYSQLGCPHGPLCNSIRPRICLIKTVPDEMCVKFPRRLWQFPVTSDATNYRSDNRVRSHADGARKHDAEASQSPQQLRVTGARIHTVSPQVRGRLVDDIAGGLARAGAMR